MSSCDQPSRAQNVTLVLRNELRKEASVRPNPMKTMRKCLGTCAHVPDEVFAAVLDSLQVIPEESGNPDACDARAVVIAQRMALEGWRFCPCFPEGATPRHARIFGLVQTNFANSLAHSALLNNALLKRALSTEKLSAA
jgi:hypothetical protein